MLYVQKLNENAKLPTVAHMGEDLGYDIYAAKSTLLRSHQPNWVYTGIACHYDDGIYYNQYGLLVRDRSSMAGDGLWVVGGVIDAGYRGEIIVMLNTLQDEYPITVGDKIAQLLPIKVRTDGVIEVVKLPETTRNEKGFGSSGK